MFTKSLKALIKSVNSSIADIVKELKTLISKFIIHQLNRMEKV